MNNEWLENLLIYLRNNHELLLSFIKQNKSLKMLPLEATYLAWIQYDEELFNTFEKKPFSRANLKHDEKDHYYIPVHHLQTIYKKPSKCLIKLKR
jgi:bifunctional pyridoxal-dependent enzyme with beta-cystathionase and maltose regulon repressor activities